MYISYRWYMCVYKYILWVGVSFCWPAWCSIDPWYHSIHLHPSLWSLLSHPGVPDIAAGKIVERHDGCLLSRHVMVNIGSLPVEVGGLSRYIQGSIIHPKGVCLEFLPSTACLKSARCQPADTCEKRFSTCHVVTTQRCGSLQWSCIETYSHDDPGRLVNRQQKSCFNTWLLWGISLTWMSQEFEFWQLNDSWELPLLQT